MEIYLVQHGEAVPEAVDPARPLTERGREEVQRVARHAAAAGLPGPEIRHSGRLRARQTAEILAQHLLPAAGPQAMEGIGPADDPAAARAVVEAAREPLMVVGHLPHLSRLASLLIAGDRGRELIRFRNGAIVCLGRDEAGWSIRWILTPELARVQPPL